MKKLTIYGHEQCRWCHAARNFADSVNIPYDYKNVRESDADMAELVRRLPDAKTVPQIFVGDVHIGGYSDFYEAVNSGSFTKFTGENHVE
jgi:glutaredoxin